MSLGRGPGLSREKVPFVPGTVPVCPGHRPAENVYVYWFFSWRLKVRSSRFASTLSGTSVWRPQSRYTVSRIECRIKIPQNQRCRAKIALHPPKSIGSVPTTPDPNTSAKVSRYKWEAYRDTNWWCIYYFLPQGEHTFAKVCHRNGGCIAIFFHMYWGQGSV